MSLFILPPEDPADLFAPLPKPLSFPSLTKSVRPTGAETVTAAERSSSAGAAFFWRFLFLGVA